MLRRSNLPVLAALAVGAAGGWAAASGRLDSLLKAEQKSAGPTTCPVGGSRENPDRAASVAALAAHNERFRPTSRRTARSRTSWSSSATTSARRTSAPTLTG